MEEDDATSNKYGGEKVTNMCNEKETLEGALPRLDDREKIDTFWRRAGDKFYP